MPALDIMNPILGGLAFKAKQDERQRQLEQQQQLQDLSQAVALGGTQSPAYNQLLALDPNRAQAIGGGFEQLEDNRKKALFQDAREIKTRIESGDTQGAFNLLGERTQLIQQMGGDPSDTIEIIQDLQANPQTALDKLKMVELIGEQRGFLEDRTPKSKAFEKEKGGLVFNPNTGKFTIDEVAKARFDELSNKKQAQGGLSVKDIQGLNKDITNFTKEAKSIKDTASDLSKLGLKILEAAPRQ